MTSAMSVVISATSMPIAETSTGIEWSETPSCGMPTVISATSITTGQTSIETALNTVKTCAMAI